MRYLAAQKLLLLEMLLQPAPRKKQKVDPRSALDFLCRLDRLHHDGMAQIRRSVELSFQTANAPPVLSFGIRMILKKVTDSLMGYSVLW